MEKYNSQKIEKEYYKIWKDRGYFEVDGNKSIQKKDKYFSIMIPPPNVTGVLHIGHALTYTIQDIIVRYKRMDGFKTLWQPGLDHAGIATQNIVDKQIRAEGSTKETMGKEKFIERVWEWKEKSGGKIFNQMESLGVSPAWSRSRFTMDDGLKESVKTSFVSLYNKGLIYHGNYMVNWCVKCGALSDIEVEHKSKNSKLYYMKYFLENSDEFLSIATTRPETYFGDTAVMVHPDDERYKGFIGKNITLPLIGKNIKIIADTHVDMEFGSGVVKVTPAHDVNDYEVGKRHNLEFVTIFDDKGFLNESAKEFKGLDRLKSRKVIIDKLQEEGFIEKIEDYNNSVGHCYRCDEVIEPYISKQWFIKKDIATKSIAKVNNGELKFFPKNWINSYNSWMNDLRDWCISRQLWWGHKIPVFYCDDCDYVFASIKDNPKCCEKCSSSNIRQDEDVLDTWFSSGLWAFSTLGWENGGKMRDKYQDDDLKNFFPNSLLVTGFDILFFWVARMIMMSDEELDELPFKDVYLHALVRDEHGNKMSKSRGNVIDPLDVVEEYSADIIRFTLAYLCVQGRDIKLSVKSLGVYRNFTNKVHNACNFLLLNHDKFSDVEIKTPLGRYMQSRLNLATKEIRVALDDYRFNESANILYRFVWNEFCDIGIELSKSDKASIVELGAIMKETLKLISPFMPFISEYNFHRLSGTSLEDGDSISVMAYPDNERQDEEIENTFSTIMEAIKSIRRLKILANMESQKIDNVFLQFKDKVDEKLVMQFAPKMAKVLNITFVNEKLENAIVDIGENVVSYLQTKDIDLTPLLNKLNKQKEKTDKEIDKLSNLLNNENFVKNATEEVVEKNNTLLKEAKEKMSNIENQLKDIL